MTDELSYPDSDRELEDRLAKLFEELLPSFDPILAEATQRYVALRQYIEEAIAAMDEVGRDWRSVATAPVVMTDLNVKALRVAVPTLQELSDTETDLRSRVLRETSKPELQRAIREIPDDPEKLKACCFPEGSDRPRHGRPGLLAVDRARACLLRLPEDKP
jgi:hypothetical protein